MQKKLYGSLQNLDTRMSGEVENLESGRGRGSVSPLTLSTQSPSGKLRKSRSFSFFNFSSVTSPLPGNPLKNPRFFSFSSATNSLAGDPLKNAPRLIERNLPFHQSGQMYNIYNSFGKHKWTLIKFLFSSDYFHVMLRWPTSISMGCMVFLWTVFILIFAKLYMLAEKLSPALDCGLGTSGSGEIPWHTAFAFSLETSTTVGYGLPGDSGAFFGNCPLVQVTIFSQMIFSMIFNAFLLSFLFARFSRCETRSNQVLFTKNAVVRKGKDGHMILEVKVYDVDSQYPLVESHVRIYAVQCSLDRSYVPLRIMSPNDDLGATLCASLPTKIVHHIDAYSALLPPNHRLLRHVVNDHGLTLREADSTTGGRDGMPCPICGEMFGTSMRLANHISYCTIVEKHDGVPIKGSHQQLSNQDIKRLTNTKFPEATYDDIRDYCETSKLEIIVIVESINPLTSASFQAIQSYQSDDIVFGGKFVPVFTEDNEVDLEKFHEVVQSE